ncbi:MAG: zinc finger domain-containing protein [Cutibacterium avidum]|nr:zinc finger domain-containing protein [Cutibacterium avidum]MDU1064278.1 zinc finger domain-containing protein [Cutibacterium avidum]MDU5516376.1 zinc finger domain-containing protein [Cutibacterium avidum]
MKSGYFDRTLDVYGSQGKECRCCGTVIVRESFANRSSHRCSRCQRSRR